MLALVLGFGEKVLIEHPNKKGEALGVVMVATEKHQEKTGRQRVKLCFDFPKGVKILREELNDCGNGIKTLKTKEE